MAWTQTDLDAIEEAIKTGELRVRYGDREITYRSVDEMLRIRDLIRNALGLTGENGGRQRRYLDHSKGL